MSEKITKTTYQARKIASIKKDRLKKKALKNIDKLWLNYCFKKYGKTLNTTFYAVYNEALMDLIPNHNKFLLQAFEDSPGQHMVEPFTFGSLNENTNH